MNTNKKNLTINVRGRLMDFGRPRVMGIVNATPDSFYAGSRCSDATSAADRAAEMLSQGADMIDLGACSTRPGASMPTAAEEWERLDAALSEIRARFPDVIISIDTFRADVARKSIERWNADIINDISGGDMDPEMWGVVAEAGVPYVAMHTRGNPDTMTSLTDYEDVTATVLQDLARKLDGLHQAGVADVIIDPGFGFAKTVDQNFELLARLEVFSTLNAPLLAGVSRKTMIWKKLGITPAEALNGTTAINTMALMKGADILRVHDVKEAAECVSLFMALRRNSPVCPNTIDTFTQTSILK